MRRSLEELTSLNRSKKLRRLRRIEDKKEEISRMKLLEAASKGAAKTKMTLELLEVKMSGFSSAESLISTSRLWTGCWSQRGMTWKGLLRSKEENQDLWLVMLQGP